MNSNLCGYDSVLQEAWTTLHTANHMAVAYRHRATQLTKWKRLRDFISLGVAPGLLCATFVWENVVLRNSLFIISGICSVSSWVWFIFGFSYNWDNQLKLSIDIPPKLSLIISEIKENIEIITASQNNNKTQTAEPSFHKLKKLIHQVRTINEDAEREQVHAKPWMNLIAQQDTMRFYDGQCGSCYQRWIPGSEVLNSDLAKKLLNEAKRGKLKGICRACGQNLPNQP